MSYDVTLTSLLKQWKIRTSAKPDKLYINREVMTGAFRKYNFY